MDRRLQFIRKCGLTFGLFLVVSCARSDQQIQSEVIIRDGTEVRLNYRPKLGTVPGEVIQARDLLIVEDTGPEMPPEAALGGIRSVNAGPNGELIVLDWRLAEIKVFGSEGGFIRHFGELGSGPGEFEQVAQLVALDRQRITVLDRFPWLLKCFDLSGRFIEQYRLPPRTIGVATDPEGGFYIVRNNNQGSPQDRVSTYYLQRIDANGDLMSFGDNGAEIDSIGIVEVHQNSETKLLVRYTNNPVRSSLDGEVLVVGPDYSFYRVNRNGIVSVFQIALEPYQYPSWYLAETRRITRDAGREPSAAIKFQNAPNASVIDENNHLWVQPFYGANMMIASSYEEYANLRLATLDEFDEQGIWLRQVLIELPPPASSFIVTDAANGFFYGILGGLEMEISKVAKMRRP